MELGIGAAMVWLVRYLPSRSWLLEPALIFGLAMIASAVFIYTSETRFPGMSALLPCIGTALALYAGQARLSGILLRNPLSVALGKWSYSIYLVHWPLYVFFLAYVYRTPLPYEQGLLIIASVAFGWAQYRFIEERFRHERAAGAWNRPAFGLGCALLSIAMIVPAATTWATEGARWRIPSSRLMKSNSQLRAEEHRKYCNRIDQRKPRDIFTCQNYRGKKQDIIIWGDSHALHLVAGFSERFKDHNVYVAYLSGCVPQSGFEGYVRDMGSAADTQKCINRNMSTLKYIEDNPVDLVVVTSVVCPLKSGPP